MLSARSASRSPGADPREPLSSPVADRWARVKSLFFQALDRAPADRAWFLAETCADDESIRREVESLLDSERQAGGFIETPAAALLVPTGSEKPSPAALAPGTFLGAYEILGFLEAGGMSQVYRARDSRLGRTVAIKVVGGADSAPRAGRRLLREARHASSLDHPCVCTIHEVDEADGRPFIVMEYVPGRTLRDLVCDGPLAPTDVVRFGVQIADALEHAHQRGVIH